MHKTVSAPPLETDEARIIERPDGFYWEDKGSLECFGPFETREAAVADMQFSAESSIEPGETLEEAEAEIGIAEWVDQDIGAPSEEWRPRLEEH
jgi:hypothetical protein